MFEALNQIMLRITDFFLGWMLYLPKDVALGIVSVVTAILMTVVRPFTTDQDLLGRCKNDKKKLKGFMREARKARDKEALVRYRATDAQIGLKAMRSEGKPLLVVLIPVLLLAVWAFARLGFEAPQPGEPVIVRTYFPASAIDGVAYVVPAPGVTAKTGWVQRITLDPNMAPGGKPNGWATWELAVTTSDAAPHELQLRYQGKTYPFQLLVDGRQYSPVLQTYDDPAVQGVQLDLKTYKPFGVLPVLEVPGKDYYMKTALLSWLSWLRLDAWLVGYVVIAVPFVFILRWALNIH